MAIPTASEFDRIVTPKGKPSSSQRGYMKELLANQKLGYPPDEFEDKWTLRGKELEPQARKMFEFINEVTVEQIGFVTTNDGLIGCSPDGFARWRDGSLTGLELKAPKHSTHMGYMAFGLEDEYIWQVQGSLLVCDEIESWDLVSYCPEFGLVSMRSTRNTEYQKVLREELDKFNALLMSKSAEIDQRYGPFLRPEPEQQSEAIGSLGVTMEDVDMLWEHTQKGVT